MSHWKKSYPSKYLQAVDLDAPRVVTIARVANENVGADGSTELKLVVFFEEADTKGVVLNLTRCEAIEAIAKTPDTDHWPGTRIQLQRGTTRFQGRKVDCIAVAPVSPRIVPPRRAATAAPPVDLGAPFEEPAKPQDFE